MKVNVHNVKNEVVESVELPERIWNAQWNPDLVHQALLVFSQNRQAPYAYALGRGDIRGGGRKPWRQKGTGRARQGSIRSPLWKGGGVSHGPKAEKNLARRINKKMKRLALFSLLSKKQKDGEMRIVDSLESPDGKTRAMASRIAALLGARPNALVVGGDGKAALRRALANIPGVDAISARSLNVYDILRHRYLVFDRGAVEVLEKHYKI